MNAENFSCNLVDMHSDKERMKLQSVLQKSWGFEFYMYVYIV